MDAIPQGLDPDFPSPGLRTSRIDRAAVNIGLGDSVGRAEISKVIIGGALVRRENTRMMHLGPAGISFRAQT